MKIWASAALGAWLIGLAGAWAGGTEITVVNSTLSVTYDDAAGTFSVTENSSGKVVLTDGRLLQGGGAAERVAIKDSVFGDAWGIAVTHPDGAISWLELPPDLPFLLVKSRLVNQTNADEDVAHSVPMTVGLDLEKPAEQLKTLGTGGLLAADKNPGSYLFLTCADPATRRGVVAGWVTEDRGSGVIFSGVKDDRVNFTAQIDYGHLKIPSGQSADLETLAIGVFDDARLGEEAYADAVNKQYDIELRPRTAVYCTWYSEQHGKAGDEQSTEQLAAFAARELKPFGLGVIQIDDDWQDGKKFNGSRRGFDRARPDGPYPHGIAPVAAEVQKDGLTFGLWFLPFGRNYQDPAYKDRQDWFVKGADGKPYDTAWGGTCLDLTNPNVQAQLAMLAKTYRSWGVRYFKMDGLWTGTASEQIYVNDGYKDDHFGNNQPFGDPMVTNIQAYRSGLKLLRDNAGDDVFFSGCCIAQNMREMTAIGLVDSMRIGPDANGDPTRGPLRGSRLYFLNGRVWWNDPDPAIVRASGSGMGGKGVTLEEAQLAASWVAITGQFFLVSDWLPALPAERLDVLKRTMQSHDAVARPVDCFDNALPTTWLVTDTSGPVRRDVIGVFNWDKTSLHVDYPLAKLGLDPSKRYHAFDFWGNAPVADISGNFALDVPPNSCRIIAVRPAGGEPTVVSTSRHVTQGILDVKDESWKGQTLSGTSELIGGDPYELRVAGLSDGLGWTVKQASVSEDDKAAGVTIQALPAKAGEEGWARFLITGNRETRVVNWELRFESK